MLNKLFLKSYIFIIVRTCSIFTACFHAAMVFLYFKILVYADSSIQPNVQDLILRIGQCNLQVDRIQRVELEKRDKNVSPALPEWIYDVRAKKVGYEHVRNKTFLYEDLCLRWCTLTDRVNEHKTLLQISNNECFSRKRVSQHFRKNVSAVSLGVQAMFGEYIPYHTLCENRTVSFSHDTKELEILISFFNNPFTRKKEPNFCQISYNNIRNIFISLTSGFELYIDLLHPPIYSEYRQGKVSRALFPNAPRDVIGKSNILCLKIQGVSWLELISCLRASCDNIPIHVVGMKSKIGIPPAIPNMNLPNFGCMYMWTALVKRSLSFIQQANNIDTCTNKVLNYCLANPICLEKALTEVLFMMDSGRLINYWLCIDILYNHYLSMQRNGQILEWCVPDKCRLIRRATITPTRVLLWPPDLMSENRILRNFDSEYFLRVTFRDDDLSTMNFKSYKDEVFDEVMKFMNHGLQIGNRFYEMLAWSSSQLREHGVSMYARDLKGQTAHYIRRWTEIDPRTNMTVPKCLARIGQCFSQTEDPLNLPLKNASISYENDIEGGFNPATLKAYCFSDGVGKISTDLAKQVGTTLKHKDCSAYQIRYGGCKGMLVIDPNLRDKQIVFRESMRKFDCVGESHTKLEIAKKSAPIRVRLNRPLIAILHDLGVPKEKFLRLQEDMLQNLTDMLLEEEKAAEYLNFRFPFSNFKIKDLSLAGVCLTVEPFFRTLLLALHKYSIDEIKSRANIDISPDKGRNMFGVLDETGILQYGEVFVQYSRDVSLGVTTPEDTVILKGTVMVTKCPCIHAGDVRKFRAVNVLQLHHIIDCIVFPQHGPRPHPDEMAGSDLDGDEYTVIWEKDLYFQGENVPPPDYPKPNPEQFLNVTDFLLTSDTKEIVSFLTTYIQNDTIRSIASSHLAHADADDSGIQSDICETLVMKHAIAVDFAKTGVSKRLSYDEVPRAYPDFMEKYWKEQYRSKKSLGVMYRVSRDFENENQTCLNYHDVQVDPTLVVNGWEEFEKAAMEARDKYNSTLKTILHTYGISHETEAFGGCFIRLHDRFKDRRDKKEIVNLVRLWLKDLITKTKASFFEGLTAITDANDLNDAALRKASAWYVVTYREKYPEFLSFPWVMAGILANKRILCPAEVRPKPYIPLIPKLDEIITQNEVWRMLPVLNQESIKALQTYTYVLSNPGVVEKAIRVLIKWGDDERIISTVDASGGKYLYQKTFIKIVLFIAEREGFISKNRAQRNPNLTPAKLVLAFFKYCMKLRFLSKIQMKQVLPFFVYNDRLLAKRALVAYHSLAISGIFPTLCTQEFVSNPPEDVVMKPFYLNTSLFGNVLAFEIQLAVKASILQALSQVSDIQLRINRQKQKIIVSAYGTVQSIKRLREILHKGERTLQYIFTHGVLPAVPIIAEDLL